MKKELFLKRYWDEEEVMFYFHVIDKIIIQQIEEWPKEVIYRDRFDECHENRTTHVELFESESELAEYEIISEEIFKAKWKK